MVTKGLPAVVLAVALGLGFAAREATASVSIPVTNYNFSDPLVTQNSGYYNQGTPNNWSTQGFSAQYFENAANGGFASGTPGNLSNIQPGLSGPNYQYVADDGHGTIYQDLGVAFKPDTTYTVDISGGNRAGFGGNYTTFGLVAGTGSIPTDGSAPTPLGGTAGFINEGRCPLGRLIGLRSSVPRTPRCTPLRLGTSFRWVTLWSTSTTRAAAAWSWAG